MESNPHCREVHFGDYAEDDYDVRVNASMAVADLLGWVTVPEKGADQ